ncbi:MAG: hypothetical protein V4644_03525 [Patescibacteria group bacterium]
MKTPSIESIFARSQGGKSYPIAKRLHDAPVIGLLARAWMRSTRHESAQSLWASLPPVAAA